MEVGGELMKLLRGKNRCLQRFLDSSAAFLSATDAGDFTGLGALQARRESIIRAMDLFDRRIANSIARLPSGPARKEATRIVEPALAEGERLVTEILAIDDRILVRIAAERDRVAGEIAASRKTQSTLSKFKSSWVGQDSGQEIDSTS